MRKTTLAATLILAAVAITVPVQAQETAKIVVEEKVIDLGKVPQGEVRDVTFTIKNEGEATLNLMSVRPTCGCTVAEWPKEIDAGGEGVIAAKLDTAGFKGGVAKSILVQSNDPKNSVLTLVIKATIEPYIEVLPRALVRFNVLEGDEAVQKVVVSGTSRSGDFKITGAKAFTRDDEPDPGIAIEYRRLEANERIADRTDTQYEVTIRLTDDADVGIVTSKVKLTTTAKQMQEVGIRVFGNIRSVLGVSPPDVQFGTVEARRQPGQNIIVENRRPQGKVAITAATINDPAFATEILALTEGKKYQITVTVKPDAAPGIKDAVLLLKTSDPEFNELRVPVRASIR